MDFYYLAHENETNLQMAEFYQSCKKLGDQILKKRSISSSRVRIKMLSASVGPCRDDSVNSVVTEADGGAAPAVWMVNHNIDFQYGNSTRPNDLRRPENTPSGLLGFGKAFQPSCTQPLNASRGESGAPVGS